MLKYKIKLQGKKSISKFDISDSFYLDPSLIYVSGFTGIDNGINNDTQVLISTPMNKDMIEARCVADDVIIQGEISYQKEYTIESKYVFNDNNEKEEVRFVFFNGKYIYVVNSSLDFGDGNIISGIDNDTKSVTVNVKAYICDGKTIIDGDEYYVDVHSALSGETECSYVEDIGARYNSISDSISNVDINVYPKEQWFKKTRVVLYPDNFKYINVYETYPAKCNLYTIIDGESYPIYNISGDTFGIKYNGKEYECNGAAEYIIGIGDYVNFDNTTDAYVTICGNTINAYNSFSIGDNGTYITLMLGDTFYDFVKGKRIHAKRQTPRSIRAYVNEEEGSCIYNGKKYAVVKDECDFVEINGNYYMFEEKSADGQRGVININGEFVVLKIEGDYAVRTTRKMFLNGDDVDYDFQQAEAEKYRILHRDGIIIEGEKYYIDSLSDNSTMDDEGISYKSAFINRNDDIVLEVVEQIGNSQVICRPLIYKNGMTQYDIVSEMTSIVSSIKDNLEEFKFYYNANALGMDGITYDMPYQLRDAGGYNVSISATTSTDDMFDYKTQISFYKVSTEYNIKLPLSNIGSNNILKEDYVDNTYISSIRNKSINSIVDMDKDVYYPFIIHDEEKKPATEIQLNFHFRTRDKDTLKVIEDNGNNRNCNWNIFDNQVYNSQVQQRPKEMISVSDLVGFIGFDDDDVFRQKKRLSKSFVRFSFYNSNDINSQRLLYTSTIFLDENILYHKYANNINITDGIYVNLDDSTDSTDISVFGEKISASGYDFSDDIRLSTRFTIKNKYQKDTSSEGFYLYMFKEYLDALYEGVVYLKIEFNHAGLGKKIPMVLPMKENEDGSIVRQLTFESNEDIDEIKEGIPIKNIYKQMFIKLHVKYDFDSRKYIYYLGNEYDKSFDENHTKIILNLFELKVKNEA